MTISHLTRIKDIAAHAGVSTATVDRVLNNRSNVRPATRQRVMQALQALQSGSVVKPQTRPWRLKVILPRDAGPSTEFFSRCIQDIGGQGHATIEVALTAKMEPVQLARKLRSCLTRRIDAVAFMALDDPRVSSAVEELASANIPCITVMSGMERAPTIGHIGSSNRSAGRTAGFMMGHMTRTPGDILIITGSELYRAHEAREIGFRTAIRHHFSHIGIAASLIGQDDIKHTAQLVTESLDQYPKLVGIYNAGAGNQGVVKAIKKAGVADELTVIGHNLTHKTHAYLLDGSMNAIIHQNLRHAAKLTIDTLIDYLQQPQASRRSGIVPVEIVTRENIDGVVFGTDATAGN